MYEIKGGGVLDYVFSVPSREVPRRERESARDTESGPKTPSGCEKWGRRAKGEMQTGMQGKYQLYT